MAEPKNNNTSFFQKVMEAGNAYLDTQIFKARSSIQNANIEEDFHFGKAVVEDPSYAQHSQGFLDKPYRIQNSHLKQMSYQDTAIAAVIQTRQNQGANHTRLVKSRQEKGFMIVLKDAETLLAKIKEEIKAEQKATKIMSGEAQGGDGTQSGDVSNLETEVPEFTKAEQDTETQDASSMEGIQTQDEENDQSDDEVEFNDFELDRKARAKLDEQTKDARKAVEQFILNCGKLENRPFESLQWNFEGAVRAWIRDTLTYDLYGSEKVADRAGRLHYWFPIDGGTIKKASKDLKRYRDMAETFSNIDILYPEREKEAGERQKAIQLDEALLQKDAYKWVQVIRGKVERAYTADELAVGIRNKNTDIYNNGYGISELELLISMVTGHLNAEYYNQAYFTQGFSAKGILHIKAALNRRKVDSVRTQWHHMLKGARNSFQTPIFAGVEDVNWIPLTQNHNDIGFEGWMRYLVTMIGAIYQIDPAEMGIHFKAEGGGGSMGSQESSKDKIDNSKDKGLYPLLKHLETYINSEIIKPFDARFIIQFTGCTGENSIQTLNRQKEESKFKKTLNEIRAEDGLPALPGGDDLILGPEYITWYTQFSPKALQKQAIDRKDKADQAKQAMGTNGMNPEEQTPPNENLYDEGAIHMNDQPYVNKSLKKSKRPLKIEIYKTED